MHQDGGLILAPLRLPPVVEEALGIHYPGREFYRFSNLTLGLGVVLSMLAAVRPFRDAMLIDRLRMTSAELAKGQHILVVRDGQPCAYAGWHMVTAEQGRRFLGREGRQALFPTLPGADCLAVLSWIAADRQDNAAMAMALRALHGGTRFFARRYHGNRASEPSSRFVAWDSRLRPLGNKTASGSRAQREATPRQQPARSPAIVAASSLSFLKLGGVVLEPITLPEAAAAHLAARCPGRRPYRILNEALGLGLVLQILAPLPAFRDIELGTRVRLARTEITERSHILLMHEGRPTGYVGWVMVTRDQGEQFLERGAIDTIYPTVPGADHMAYNSYFAAGRLDSAALAIVQHALYAGTRYVARRFHEPRPSHPSIEITRLTGVISPLVISRRKGAP